MIEYQYFSNPTPHIFLPQLLPAKQYREIVFPHLEPSAKGRIGRDLYEGEPGYGELIASPGWRDLHGMFTSWPFVEWVLTLFAKDLERLGCKVNPAKAFYEPYIESRDTVHDVKGQISDRDVNALFTRFDIQAADSKYAPYVHLDRIRRLTGGLLFCADRGEEELIGGEFALYCDRFFANDRRCFWPKLVKTFTVRHNTGVIFLNANTAFHGPRRMYALRGVRKWVYYAISSHQPVWSPQDSSRARNLAFKGKYVLNRLRRRVAWALGR